MPARGDRCLSFNDLGEDADDADDDDGSLSSDCDASRDLPRSPFATPEDSDSEAECGEDEEWSECLERRRQMFARMCPTGLDDTHPQFEGYRSLSATLRDLLASVEDVAQTPEEEEQDAAPAETPFPVTGVFSRLREDSVDTEVGTPSLISSADSDGECSRLQSPRGSAVDFVPTSSFAKGASGGSPVRVPYVRHLEHHELA